MLARERIVTKGLNVLDELKEIYSDGEVVIEYEKLLNDYEKLSKRYEKILKISDNFELNFYKRNNDLIKALNYTVKTARVKIMDNIAQHKKTKLTKEIYRQKISTLEDELEILIHQNRMLKEKVNYYIENYGDVDSVFNKNDILEYLIKFSLNSEELKNKTIHEVLENETKQNKEYSLCKIGIDEFDLVLKSLKHIEYIENYLKLIYKYISTSFHNEDIIYHYEHDEFYILIENRDENNLIQIINKLNNKREILGVKLKFIAGVVNFNSSMNYDLVLENCNNSYNKANLEKSKIVFYKE